MKACLLLKRPLGDPRSPVVNALASELEARRWKVDALLPQGSFIDLASVAVDADIYLFRTSAEVILSLGGILHDRGAHLVNSFAASSYVRDKARVTAALVQAGLNVPRTCYAGDAMQAWEGMGRVPIVIKPPRGSGGRGIEISRDERDAKRINGGPHFAQIYDRLSPYDLKVFVIGEEVFVVRRRFPAVTEAQKQGELCAPSQELRRTALDVGRLFGLDIYGIDVVETSRGPVIVDVNSSPGLVGVPDAARRVADLLERRARQ